MSTESAAQSSATKGLPRARHKSGESLALIERTGEETILDRYAGGESLLTIANAIGVSYRTLAAYLAERALPSAYAHARECYAETWAARGWDCLQMKKEDGESDLIDSATVNRARYMEMHCRWRAGVASARYSEKQSVELSGPNGGPIQQAVVHVFVPANNRDTVVNTVDDEG